MSDNLVSKKELLEITGISYGQLYRWKRKKLIPEEWFIKKSSFTGQETFFPKDKILGRIDRIVNMKDGLSLDEIADMFEPKLQNIFLKDEELKEKGIVSEFTINIYKMIHADETAFSLEKILYMFILEKFMKSGEVSLEEGKNIIIELEYNYKKLDKKNFNIILFRKFGVPMTIILENGIQYFVDEGMKEVHKENIISNLEELKLKVRGNSVILKEN